MQKLILKYWIITVLGLLVLMVIYRVVISYSDENPETFLDKILEIIAVFYSLAMMWYSAGILFLCSFSIFLNLWPKVRKKPFLSYLSFAGLPFLYLLFQIKIALETGIDNPVKYPPLYAFVYFGFASGVYFVFRKAVERNFIELKPKF